MPWLLRCTPYDPALPGERTLYFSDIGLMTTPSDTPADTYWKRRIDAPFDAQTSLFAGAMIGGRSEVSYGKITLANDDGELDAIADYDWGGRTVEVRWTTKEQPVLSDFVTIFNGTASSVIGGDLISIELRDMQVLFDGQYQTAVFAGTGGVEGHAGLKGRRKPRLLGVRRHIEPVEIETTKRIFAYGSGPSGGVLAVYDGGLPLTAGANHASYAALEAATVAAGDYATCNALSLLRLGRDPVSVLTIDAEGVKPSATVLKRFGELAEYIITTDTALTASDFTAGTVTAANAAAPQTLGHWYSGDQEMTIRDVLDQLAQTPLAHYSVGADRKITLGVFVGPVGPAAFTFTEDDIFSITPTLVEGRLKKQTVRYQRRERTLSGSEVLGNIIGDAAEELRREWKQEVHTDAAVATAALLAREETLDSALDIQAEALALAQSRVALFGPARKAFTVSVPITDGLRVGQTISIQHSRYGLAAGRLVVVLSLDPDASTGMHEMEVWG